MENQQSTRNHKRRECKSADIHPSRCRRIAFVIKQPGFLRYIQTQIEKLCELGVHLHIGIQDWPIVDDDGLLTQFCSKYPNVSVGWAPQRGDKWTRLSGLIGGCMDYCHYLFRDFDNSETLRRRARKHAGQPGIALYKVVRLMRLDHSHWAVRMIMSILRRIEAALPPDPDILRFIRQVDADLVLVTGLVWPRSPQPDYVTACRRLNIHTGYIVNSWDNLTNKGDIKAIPDRVFVWNSDQAQEAVRLHGVPKERVIVTGAPLFDRWFVRRASESRKVFLNKISLPDDRSFILYVCSSPAIAPGRSERDFFMRWWGALKDSDHNQLKDCHVIVRPHPFNHVAWRDFHEPGVAVFPKFGGWIVKETDRDDYFNSLFYCSAVVGINTSAMIEAAIVGARTFTLCTDEFVGTQDGTVHFHYLTERGIVECHQSFDNHFKAIAEALESVTAAGHRMPLSGVVDFVRPFGSEQPCTEIAVEAARTLAASPPVRYNWRFNAFFWRPLLWAALFFHRINAFLANNRKARKKRKSKGKIFFWFRFFIQLAGYLGLKEKIESQILPQVMKVSNEFLRHKTDILQLSLTDPRDQRRLAFVSNHLKTAVQGKESIIVGPWITEIGFEVLYWIPFLRWFCEKYQVRPERLIAVSRGGTRQWYAGVADGYVEVFDILSPDEFRKLNEQRVMALGHQKQSRHTKMEDELYAEAAKRLGIVNYRVLHPSVMFRLFAKYWKGELGFEFIDLFTRFQSMRAAVHSTESEIRKRLPANYVAAKFYFRESFPDSEPNRTFISNIIKNISRNIDVVSLDTGICVDDHVDCGMRGDGNRIHTIEDWLQPSNNLAVQTEVIAGAQLYIGTYGGMTYVASLLGVPAICFESRPELNLSVHTELAMRKLKPLGGSFHLINVENMEFWSWLANAIHGHGISAKSAPEPLGRYSFR
ncbi:MAG: hypothetical protein HY895_05695 [Deltaproteobacteria bacterium]|nr:hypothetical protein [Deltaproteobacteria bacterium]